MIKSHRWTACAATTAVTAALALTASSAMALTVPVAAGPARPTKVAHLDMNGFFPTTTRVHVGDSISFAINGFHTVTFLSGAAAPPLIIPDEALPIAGKLDAAGAPFWFNGQPNLIINPAVQLPSGGSEYSGEGVVNSGLPNPEAPPAPFVVKFTKAGQFTFDCLVHPGMKGTVKVVAGKGPVPSVHLQKARAKAQEAKAIVSALHLKNVKPPGKTVLAGNDGKGPVAWLRFFPKTLRVKPGTTVEFKIASQREVHTITIGPEAYTGQIEETFTTPVSSGEGPPKLLVNPLAGYPSDPPPLPANDGTNHGNGFSNSGVLSNAGPPLSPSVKVTFTKPGTYSFECVIHPEMDGKIVVTKK
jgi:plastocyanin